jgi:hypothetical protein
VALDNGSTLACQMVCIGKGVRPNVEFLAGSGVAVDGGIVADRYTGASLPDTYTAGDVAVTYEPVTGAPIMTALWTNAVEMGRCAGLNMAGVKTVYTGTFGILNATQVADEPFVSMGVVHTTGKDCEVHQKSDGQHLPQTGLRCNRNTADRRGFGRRHHQRRTLPLCDPREDGRGPVQAPDHRPHPALRPFHALTPTAMPLLKEWGIAFSDSRSFV